MNILIAPKLFFGPACLQKLVQEQLLVQAAFDCTSPCQELVMERKNSERRKFMRSAASKPGGAQILAYDRHKGVVQDLELDEEGRGIVNSLVVERLKTLNVEMCKNCQFDNHVMLPSG